MGGSSLAPSRPRGGSSGRDGRACRSTSSTRLIPLAVRAATAASDPAGTLYLISSKSGTTTEPLAFLAHFWASRGPESTRDLRHDAPGAHFVGRHATPAERRVTSRMLDSSARCSSTRRTSAAATARCRTSASCPAALMGLDLRGHPRRRGRDRGALPAAQRPTTPVCGWAWPWACWRRAGRDKLTLVIEPRFAALACGSSSSSPRAPASMAWASCRRRRGARRPGRLRGRSGVCPHLDRHGPGVAGATDAALDDARRGRPSGARPVHARRRAARSAASSSAGSSPRPSPAPSWASTRSTSRTSPSRRTTPSACSSSSEHDHTLPRTRPLARTADSA